MLARPRVVFSILFMLLIASAAAAQAMRAMTVDDVIDLVQVSAPRISPDGRRVMVPLRGVLLRHHRAGALPDETPALL